MNIKDSKTGNTTNSLIFHIFTNHTFDFSNSAIFHFIHDKNKRSLIEAYSIAYYKVFFKISPPLGKIIQKEFKIYTKNSSSSLL